VASKDEPVGSRVQAHADDHSSHWPETGTFGIADDFHAIETSGDFLIVAEGNGDRFAASFAQQVMATP
jgi:hypothetical protein